jgi:hypothetical protein
MSGLLLLSVAAEYAAVVQAILVGDLNERRFERDSEFVVGVGVGETHSSSSRLVVTDLCAALAKPVCLLPGCGSYRVGECPEGQPQ